MEILDRFLAGDRRALARAITWVENGAAEAYELIRHLYPRTGQAHIVGITGPPGAGKSTLVDRLAGYFRSQGKSVAIIAVDPSSPFSGGAILGDRIRMQRSLSDPGIFMRSLASRGHLGGVSTATSDVVTLMDAFGFEVILVETVGAGQSEVEIMGLAHTTVVVMVPGLGDDIQAIKAGILEIGDVFAINKADRDGADKTATEIEMMLDLGHMGQPGINHWPAGGGAAAGPHSEGYRRLIQTADPTGHHADPYALPAGVQQAVTTSAGGWLSQAMQAAVARHGTANPGDMSWRPPVLKTVAKDDNGVAALGESLQQHLQFLQDTGRWEARKRLDAEAKLRELVSLRTARMVLDRATAGGDLDTLSGEVAGRSVDPYTAAETILRKYFGS